MAFWVQECPFCGYAYGSIEGKAPEAEKTIFSTAYWAIASDRLNGTLIGRFLKASLIAEGASDPESAARFGLYAAWAADDAKDVAGAVSNRNRAAEMFRLSLSTVDQNTEQAIVNRTRMVDILRRAMRWNEAIDLAASLLERDLEERIRAVLQFEKSAAAAQDANCYTIAQATGGE
jgi:hypothetical protein